jgi:hypothetical protein
MTTPPEQVAGFLVLDRLGSGRVFFEGEPRSGPGGEAGVWTEVAVPDGSTRTLIERAQVLPAVARLDGERLATAWRLSEH